ncbi:hypothetical protein [Roseibium sp. M-1]
MSWLQLWNLKKLIADSAVWPGAVFKSLIGSGDDYQSITDRLLLLQNYASLDVRTTLHVIEFARLGLIPFNNTVQCGRSVLDRDLPERKRVAVSRAFMNYLWERVGPNEETLTMARFLAGSDKSSSHDKLRAAALLNAGGKIDEAANLLHIISKTQPRLLLQIGYLELGVLCSSLGLVDKGHAKLLLKVRNKLDTARGTFQTLVQTSGESFIAIANGPSVGAPSGNFAEKKRLIIRFNNFPDPQTTPASIGRRTDVWIRSHDTAYVPLRKIDNLKHVVVSGCDCHHRFSNGFQHFSRLLSLGVSIEVVPTPLYHMLFQELNASPSVGLIGISWLHFLVSRKLHNDEVSGFDLDLNTSNKTLYSNGVSKGLRPGRHNWQAEHCLYQRIVEADPVRS